MYPKLKTEAKTLFIKKLIELKDQQTTGTCVTQVGDVCKYCANGVLGLTIQELTGRGRFIDNGEYFAEEESEPITGWPISRSMFTLICLDEDFTYEGDGVPGELYRMNDIRSLSFIEIAQWVEENL